MKKVIAIITVCLFAVAGNVSAQSQSAGKVVFQDFHFTSNLTEGQNTIVVPDGKGTVKFTKRGSTFSNVIYTDAAGKSTRLQPGTGAANGAPAPSCKCPVPDACFGTENKSIGMCICKPCDVSSGNGPYTIGLLLPAV